MRDIPKAVVLLGSLIGSIVVVGLIIGIVYLVKDKVDTATARLSEDADVIQELRYTQYEGDVVKGTEVLSALTKFKNDTIFVAVDNGSGTLTYYYYDANLNPTTNTIALAKNERDLSHYVYSSAEFLGSVTRDTNTGKIIGLTFVKQ